MNNTTLVIYHGGCVDGFTAAWVARDGLAFLGIAEVEFMPRKYGDEAPDVTGRDVYVLDFSWPREEMLKMKEQAKSLVVLDHHKTAESELSGLEFAEFDMERSGAGMTWDHFYPGAARVPLVNYVEDRDLWRFRLPGSKEVNAFIQSCPHTFEDWDVMNSTSLVEMKARGQGALDYINRYVREMKGQSRMLTFRGHRIPVVNAPYIGTSELVGALAEGHEFAMGWFQRGDGKYQYSLRSKGEFDVSELAKEFGGGGHKNAAGFVTSALIVIA